VPTITLLLQRDREGDAAARNELFATTYESLKQLAHSRLRESGRPDSLDTTALVHESFERFIKAGALRAADHRAFFAYASQVMRSVIVDLARERLAARRGGGVAPLTLTTQLDVGVPAADESVLRVHEALAVLERNEPRLAKVIEMRYFGGYTEAEIAGVLDLTDRTVRRDCEKGLLLLKAALM
jgi:RNA polymerase sigma factor (TIGR02999 family)